MYWLQTARSNELVNFDDVLFILPIGSVPFCCGYFTTKKIQIRKILLESPASQAKVKKQQKRGRGGPTARLALSHCPAAPTCHGYNHIARSHSSKAQISTTKQHLGNYFAYVKPESVPDLPINHVSTQTAQARFGKDEQRMSKMQKCGRCPRVRPFG